MKSLLLATVFFLPTFAYAAGEHDNFRSGIDAERPGISNDVSTNSTASDIDRDTSPDGLTQRDREVMASITNSAWGTLVSVEGNKAKYRNERGSYHVVTIDVPAKPEPKPAPKPRQVAVRAVPPTPITQPEPIPADVVSVTMPDLTAPPPAEQITSTPTLKDDLFSRFEEVLSDIKARRVNEPPPGTPLTPGETRMAHALRMLEGGVAGMLVGGWNLTARRSIEGAIGLAGLGYAKDLMGEPRYADAARDILSMSEDEWEVVANVARHQNREEIEHDIAVNKELRQQERRKNESLAHQREHGK